MVEPLIVAEAKKKAQSICQGSWENNMKLYRMLAASILTLGLPLSVSAQTFMCPDGNYVSKGPCTLCPNGKYVGSGAQCQLTPSGSYVPKVEGKNPQLTPSGGYVQGGAPKTLCPDGTYVAGTRCVLAPNGKYVGG